MTPFIYSILALIQVYGNIPVVIYKVVGSLSPTILGDINKPFLFALKIFKLCYVCFQVLLLLKQHCFERPFFQSLMLLFLFFFI